MANVSQSDKMSRLRESMSRASKLMQMETNGTLNKIAEGHRDDINMSMNSDIPTHSMMTTVDNTMPKQSFSAQQMSQSHLPSAILESFKKNPTASDSDLFSAFGTNDSAVSSLVEGLVQPKQTNTKQIVQEALHGNVNQIAQPQASSSIDYPMIKTIVEEIVRKYAVSLNKKIINESKQSNLNEMNTLMIGKKFKFLDSKGNIYEAELKKIGNINNKRGVVD